MTASNDDRRDRDRQQTPPPRDEQQTDEETQELPSVFISYGGPDQEFAEQLNDELRKRGVGCFLFSDDAIPGKKLHKVMRDGIRAYDRVVLICSRSALDRKGVLNELNKTLEKEARMGGKEILIPVRLDDYVFDEWKPDDEGIAQEIRDRVVADFRGTSDNRDKFLAGVDRLMKALDADE